MYRRIAIAFCIVLAFLSFATARPKLSDDPVFSQIDSIVKSLSTISGLAEKHPVPYGRMNKRQLRQFLNKRIKKTLKPDEIYADELSLKMFGLVPQDFDLKKSTIDLLTEQAAAFYDYDEKKLFLLDDSSFTGETTTLAHELSHALADQHFDLSKFMDSTASNDDENLAHTAVVEGQATWLMMAYDLKQSGQSPDPTPAMVKSVADSSQGSLADYPVLKGSPLYIQQSLLFPYTEGVLFFDAVYHKLGKDSFATVFENAPKDSAQIMHPERYFAHENATKPDLPTVTVSSREKDVTEGSLGEFDLEIMLRQYTSEQAAKDLAPHLRGGEFKIEAVGKERKPMLVYVSAWDSEADAAKFFGAYQKILRGKWKQCDVSTSTDTTFAGSSDSGYFVTRLNGLQVSSVEGVQALEDWQQLKATPKNTAALRISFAVGSVR